MNARFLAHAVYFQEQDDEKGGMGKSLNAVSYYPSKYGSLNVIHTVEGIRCMNLGFDSAIGKPLCLTLETFLV